jgi:peptide/nickel transport system permease protein
MTQPPNLPVNPLAAGDSLLTDAELAPGMEPADQPRSAWRRGLEVFVENKLAVVGLVILVVYLLFCYIGPIFYHGNHTLANVGDSNLSPGSRSVTSSTKYPLGTDQNGYDELGLLMSAGQISIEVGLAAALLASVWGTLYGAISGYVGGFVDALMMRVVDAALAIPSLILLIVIAAITTPTVTVMILILSAISWLTTARLIRGEALTLRVREYVQAVKVMGGGGGRIVLRHIMPNAIGTVVVNATFAIADAILTLSALGFLGLGLQPPHQDWGAVLAVAQGNGALTNGYWWEIFPVGVSIVLVVVAFNLIGDALRDSFETRLQKR